MEDWVVSMMRLSSAVTLFSVEQMQKASDALREEKGVEEAADRMSKAVDSVADALMDQMKPENKEVVHSFAETSRKAVHQMMDSAKMDPRDMMKMSGQMMEQASKYMSDWMSRSKRAGSESQGESDDNDEPKPAHEAL